MKRVFIPIVLCLCLVSCGIKQGVSPRLSGISFSAEIFYYNETYRCDCSINAENELLAVIKIPETLEGFTLTVSSGGVTAEYLGIKYTPTDGNMPFSGLLKQVYDRLMLVSDSGVAEKRDKTYILSLGEGADRAELHLAESGLPILLRLPDERFYVEFYNVTIKD